MNSVVIEHVKVSELPEAWRDRIGAGEDARVTVRIEAETHTAEERTPDNFVSDDPAFGMWRDRSDMADVEDYLRRLRAPRYLQE